MSSEHQFATVECEHAVATARRHRRIQCAPLLQGQETMMSKATRLSLLLAMLVGFGAAALPPSPAEAQWVFVARKALGRIEHMRESQQGGQGSYDFATV